MRILHVNVCAQSGSTGKIVTDITNELYAQGHWALICYGANETAKGERYYRFCDEFVRGINALCSRITGILLGNFPPFSTNKLITKIRDYSPDIVHLHCINGYTVDVFKLLDYLANNKYKVVLTLHAEFMHTGTCSHAYNCDKWRQNGCYACERARKITKSLFDNSKKSWNLMKQSFDKFDKENLIITSVSPWLMKRASMSPYMNRFQHYSVMNGLDNDVFHLKIVARDKYPTVPADKFCLYITASFSLDKNDNKGGYYIVELAKQMPKMHFVIAANYNSYLGPLPENMLFYGHVSNQNELADLYNLAELTIIASKRETFSMVTAESLCCGTPVVGFEAGGPESIAPKEFSRFVEYPNVNMLRTAIVDMMNQNVDRSIVSHNSISLYSKQVMTREYISIYKELLR